MTKPSLCNENEVSCLGTNQCILRDRWCDSIVDCLDASDEIACSCNSRLLPERLCDGYSDCPLSSDEIGCFGCDKFSYSCFHNEEEFIEAKDSAFARCYSIVERCDGVEKCFNGKDEKDCTILVKEIGPPTAYTVSYSEGYLHRNYRGQWFPVCDDQGVWAREICEAEIGEDIEPPEITLRSVFMSGPFISRSFIPHGSKIDELPIFKDNCLQPANGNQNFIAHVKCSSAKCGTVKKQEPKSPLRIRNFDRMKRDDLLGIVGGRPTDPGGYPFIVALYKNGRFHCGAIIHNEHWVRILCNF